MSLNVDYTPPRIINNSQKSLKPTTLFLDYTLI